MRAAGLDVLETPPRYVSSEESALVRLAAGGTARPVSKRRPVVEGGADPDGRRLSPTVVLNAETVLRIGQIDLWGGPQWFRSFGTPAEPGPRLVTVTGSVFEPGVVETEAGVPLVALLDHAGGAISGVGAVCLNGLSGGWLTAPEARCAVWSTAYLQKLGLRCGPGVVTVLDDGTCPIDWTCALLDFADDESAGQCGPCVFGVPALASDFRAMARGHAGTPALHHLRTLVEQLPGRGACRFPDGVASLARSTLRAFGPHLAEHAAGRCTARLAGRERADVG